MTVNMPNDFIGLDNIAYGVVEAWNENFPEEAIGDPHDLSDVELEKLLIFYLVAEHNVFPPTAIKFTKTLMEGMREHDGLH